MGGGRDGGMKCARREQRKEEERKEGGEAWRDIEARGGAAPSSTPHLLVSCQ